MKAVYMKQLAEWNENGDNYEHFFLAIAFSISFLHDEECLL